MEAGRNWRAATQKEREVELLVLSSPEVEWAVACCQYCRARAGKVPGVLMKASPHMQVVHKTHCFALEEKRKLPIRPRTKLVLFPF